MQVHAIESKINESRKKMEILQCKLWVIIKMSDKTESVMEMQKRQY